MLGENKRKESNKMKKIIAGFLMSMLFAVNAFAAFTLPTLPVTDLESAGTAVAALIAVAVVIGVVFRLLKKA
jgi:heme/copper-type cytochrome/quinol oxidase subunit 4